jgi:HK97 family phage portal protein
MSFFGALARGFGATEHKTVEFSPELWAAINGGFGLPTKSGTAVSAMTALQQATFWRCVLVIAEGCAQLPVTIQKVAKSGRGVEPATDHPLYDLLLWQPAGNLDAFQFWRTVIMHAAATGNSVCYKTMVRGQVAELLPFRPEQTDIDNKNAAMISRYSCTFDSGVWQELNPREVFHISGPRWHNHKGLDPTVIGREAIGLAQATEMTHAKLHANSARPSGAIESDKSLNEAQIARLRAQWAEYTGASNVGKTILLEGGAKWKQITMTGVDAEHLATRKHQIEEICRLMGVFPIMVGHAGDQSPTFASASEFFGAHVRYSLMPWIRAIKMAIATQLLTKEERREGYNILIDTAELLRGSIKDRAEYYKAALGSNSNPGWLRPNEIREDDGWEPSDEEGMDKVWQPMTMQPAGADPVEMPAPPTPAPTETKKSTPRTLYVSRTLKNGRELLRWAKAQGIPNLVSESELHVTIAYSRAKIDWMDIDADWAGSELIVAAGGPRVVELMGKEKNVLALLFRSWALAGRHAEIRDAGATWDWPEYQPHISISYDASGFDAAKVEPYTGELRFGPEIFAEIDLG